MKHITIVLAAALALAAALPTAPANAQNLRSFVSAHGLDTNSCVLASPCRTLAHALTQTNSGGEIDVLDAAGYGALTIDRAISIVNDGVGTAGVIVPSGGTGIIVNAGVNDTVSLRGLSIEGGGVGSNGIAFNTGKSLTVENCVIRHVTNNGLAFFPNATSHLAVSNSVVADNVSDGIVVAPTGSGTVTAVINRVEANNNIIGIYAEGLDSTGTVNVTVSESVVAKSSTAGFYVHSTVGKAPTTLTVFHSVTANNGYGFEVTGQGATLRAAQSMVTGNAGGWLATASGVIQSYGDNYIDGNGPNTGSLTSISTQ